MPQNRFCSEFSLPQRLQRTQSLLAYSLRYLTGSMQRWSGSVWWHSWRRVGVCDFCNRPFYRFAI